MTEGEQQIVALLTEIRDLLASPLPTVVEDACEHPEEKRINLLAMGDQAREFFKCRKCGQTIRN